MACKKSVGRAEKTLNANGASPVPSQASTSNSSIRSLSENESTSHVEPDMVRDEHQKGRKPYGYWKDFEHLQNELELHISQLGRMPTKNELYAIGEKSLAVMIVRFGGFREVAKRLGVPCTADYRRASKPTVVRVLTTKSVSKNTQRKRRRPNGYWDVFANVQNELEKFVHEKGIIGRMPAPSELYKAGKAGLARAIRKHGGYEFFAFWLNWRKEPGRRRRNQK